MLEIFQRGAKKQVPAAPQRRVRVLGVDEISLRAGHKQYALMLSDLGRQCVIDVLPDRKKDTFEAWLDSLSAGERQARKVVSMDMWEPYRSAVRAKLPQAQIVADRFHIMKHLNHQLDVVRRALHEEGRQPAGSSLEGQTVDLTQEAQRVDGRGGRTIAADLGSIGRTAGYLPAPRGVSPHW